MKAIKVNGLKLEMVDVDYNFIQEHMEEFVKKEKFDKASILKDLLNRLDATGKVITPEVIEEVVNKTIDENFAQCSKLKDEIKSLEKANQLLSQYSERETGDDTTSTILSMINSL